MGKERGAGANTRVRIKMADGSTVWGTLTFLGLYKLRATHPQAYKAYNAVIHKKQKEIEELDTAQLLYTAYLCALALDEGDAEGAMGFEEFLGAVTPSRKEQAWALKRLLNPKAPGDSRTRSASAAGTAAATV